MNKSFVLKFRISSSRPYNRVIGKMDDGTIKIALKAKPVEGQANRLLITYLSKKIHIGESEISIISGFNSRNKIIKIDSGNKDLVLENLLKDQLFLPTINDSLTSGAKE